MNDQGESKPLSRSPQRVVSLPCGHRVYVDPDASLIALSGPVLDHQSTCRGERTSTYAAWFDPKPFGRADAAPTPDPSGRTVDSVAR